MLTLRRYNITHNAEHTFGESEFSTLSTLLEGLVEKLIKAIGSYTLVVRLDVFLESRTAETRVSKDHNNALQQREIKNTMRPGSSMCGWRTNLEPLRSLS